MKPDSIDRVSIVSTRGAIRVLDFRMRLPPWKAGGLNDQMQNCIMFFPVRPHTFTPLWNFSSGNGCYNSVSPASCSRIGDPASNIVKGTRVKLHHMKCRLFPTALAALLTFSAALDATETAQTEKVLQFTESAVPYRWGNVVIGGGGWMVSIVLHPAIPDLLWLGSDVSGPWKREPGQDRWHAQAWNRWTPHNTGGIGGMAVDPRDGNTVYVERGDPNHDGSKELYATLDGGKTWAVCKAADGSDLKAFSPINHAYCFARYLASDRVDGETFYLYHYAGACSSRGTAARRGWKREWETPMRVSGIPCLRRASRLLPAGRAKCGPPCPASASGEPVISATPGNHSPASFQSTILKMGKIPTTGVPAWLPLVPRHRQARQ